jgi:Tfp pilus assembly protein FimT
MNRNQKIAIGCGVAGCLGLILLVILVVVLSVLGYVALPGMSSSNRNYNFNSNANGNSNSNSNANTDSNSDSNSNSDSSSSSSSMSEDDKHKLFQAAAATQDHALTRRVWEKLGLLKTDGSPNDNYQVFMKDHIGWIFRNASFVQSISDPVKARAYVDEHIDE